MGDSRSSNSFLNYNQTNSYLLVENKTRLNLTLPSTNLEEAHFSPAEKIAYTTCLVILIIFATCGNSAVLYAFYQHSQLRRVTNYFLISLSVADIAVAWVSMPIWIVFITTRVDWNAKTFTLYRLWVCVDIWAGVSSILNLTMVSVDRCVHIMSPFQYQRHVTPKRAVAAISVIWIYSIGLSMIKGFFWDWERPNYEILIFTLGYLQPLVTLAVCYTNVFNTARIQSRKMRGYGSNNRRKRDFKRDVKTIKVIAGVVSAFLLCWSPFFILNLIYGFCKCYIPDAVVTAAKWLHYANSGLNPIIYACFHKEFRGALIRSFQRKMSVMQFQEKEWTMPLRYLLRAHAQSRIKKTNQCEEKIFSGYASGSSLNDSKNSDCDGKGS